jgi:hypothetical protein
MKLIFGLFLIAHGFIHYLFISKQPPAQPGAPAWPFDITKSVILTPLGIRPEILKIIGIILTFTALIGFVLSGLGWMGIPFVKDIWVPVTVVSSIASILLIVTFWNIWFIIGPLIDLMILYFIFFNNLNP